MVLQIEDCEPDVLVEIAQAADLDTCRRIVAELVDTNCFDAGVWQAVKDRLWSMGDQPGGRRVSILEMAVPDDLKNPDIISTASLNYRLMGIGVL